MFLPLALHQAFIYTLQMFHLFGIFHLISVIFHKISTFRTNFRRRTRRRQLFAWLQQALPTGREIRHLSAVWRDGTILCDVIESVVPGSCSGQLRKFHSHKSIQHGQTLAANHLCVQPVFTNEDLHQVIFSSYLERRLLRYLTTIKSAVLERRQSRGTLSRRLRFFRRTERNATETQQVPALPPFDCFVKGMGVVVAVQLRRASFYIYLLQSSYVSHQPHASLPDISVKIEGPNSDHGEVIIQTTCFNKCSKQTNLHSQSCVCQPCERVCNIPINYSVTSGNIRVNYVPQNPGLHELSITMCDEHVPGSPYLISVDRKVPDITGPLAPGMSADKNDPRILPERRRHKVLFRIVDFVTEKMLLTEDGELKQLPSVIRVTAKRFPRQMAIHSSPHGISNSPFSCYTDDSTEEYNMQHGTISSKGKKHETSFAMSPLSGDIKQAPSLTHKLERRDLNFFRDKCKKVVLLCSILSSLNPSHSSLHLLDSAEQLLDGRPVRLTEKTFKLIESALKYIKPGINECIMYPSSETNMSGKKFLQIDETFCSVGVSGDCKQISLLMECKYVPSRLQKIKNEDRSGIDITNFNKQITAFTPNLSAVRRKVDIQASMKLNTAIIVNYIPIYEFNCDKILPVSYDIDSSIKCRVYGVNDLNKTNEFDNNRVRSKFKKELCMGTLIRNPSRQITEYLILSTIQSGKELEMMSRVNISEEEVQGEYAIVTQKTDDVRVRSSKTCVNPIIDAIHIPRGLEATEQWYDVVKLKERVVSPASGKTSKSMKICSRNDKYFQHANRPTQGISNCDPSELKLEANYKKCFQVNKNKSSTEIIGTSYFIKATEIFVNKCTPSRTENNHMNTKSRQQTGAELVEFYRNDNIPITEIKDEDNVFLEEHTRQKTAETMEADAPDNVICNNNKNSYTFSPQILRKPRGNDSLQLNIKCGQKEATHISLLAEVTFELKNRVGPALDSNPSHDNLFVKPSRFMDLEDILSRDFAASITSSSDGHQRHEFHYQSSDIALSHLGDISDYYDAIDFDLVLAAQDLEEALSKLDQALQGTKERNACGSIVKMSELYVKARHKTETPSPESNVANDSYVAEDYVVRSDIQGYGEVGDNRNFSSGDSDYNILDDKQNYVEQISVNVKKGVIKSDSNKSIKNNESRDINKSVGSKRYSVDKGGNQQLSRNINCADPPEEEVLGIVDDKSRNNTENNHSDAPLSGNWASKSEHLQHYPRISSEGTSIMTSTEEQNEGNYLPHRHMEMDVLMQEICQSIGNFTLTSEAPDGEMQQQQDEDTDIEDVTMVCSSRNIVLLEGNFTNTETLKNTPFINDKTLFGESNSCECNEMEGSGNIISEVPEYVSVTSTATTMCERKGPLDTCEDVYARVKGQECLRDHKLEEVNYKINEIKTHRESQTHNKHYLCNYLGNEYSSMTEQPAFNTNVNRQQETNKTDVRNSCTSIENIPEQVKSTLQSHSARVDYSIRNKTEISEPNQETLEGALKVLTNTVGVTKAPDPDTQHQIMIGNDLRDKSSLVLPCDSKLAHENIHVTFQPLKKMVANDDFTAGSVGNILPKTENSDNEFQFHGGSEHADTERTIFHQQITHRNGNSITTSRRLKASSEAANSLLSLNSSNENHATDESEYHKENENSPNMVRSLRRPKVICRVLPLEVMSHVKREISPSALSNTNTDFKKISSVLQCTSNKNNISCVEEWTITQRHPMVQHSSHVGRVTNSVPQVTSDRPTSRAISLPQPDVITTDTDILRPLAAQEIDPEVRLAETGSDNELSNKADMYVDNITINLSENIFCVKNKTECLKIPLLVRNSTETSFKNLHEVSATACYKDDACKIKDNYLTKQETEAEIPEMSNANSTNLVTAKSSMGSIYAGDDYDIVHPADYSVKKGMEFKLSDKIQNCATVTESNATKCYIRVVLMKHRPNVQHLPTFDYIDGFPTPMRLTRKKVNWDKKLIKQKDVTVQRERFERSVALNYRKYPTFCKSDVSHWSTNRRRASVRKSGTANERKQASDKTVSRNESHYEVIPFRNQWKFPSHDTCNENAVAQWRIYGNDLVATQNVRNKLLMYDSINITRQKLTKVSDSVTRVKFEGKFSICGNQKGTDQYDDGDDEVTSSYKFHNDEVTEHNIKSPAGINPNFVHRTSLISLQNMTLHMLSNIIFDHEVHLNCKTVNILFETGQQKEQLANNTINKQLQTLNGDGTNTAPSEIDNCNLNKMGAVKLQRSENKTYRAVLVYITDDGYIIPELQKKLSIASQNTPINNKNSQAESKNRAELFVEQNTDMQYITEKSVPNQYDDNPTVQQLICNQETEKCAQRRMSKEDARTERKLRFQRAKLFFQKHEQNELDKPHI